MSDSAYGIKFIRFTVDMDDGSTYEMVLDTPETVSYTHLTLPTNREV